MQLFLALVMVIFIGGAAGYIGSLMITKRMSLMAGALGHLTLPGVSLALLYELDVSFVALLFLLIGIVLIWLFNAEGSCRQNRLLCKTFAMDVGSEQVVIKSILLTLSHFMRASPTSSTENSMRYACSSFAMDSAIGKGIP